MAFCAAYGHISPSEYEDMDPYESHRLVTQLMKLRDADRELQVTLTKFTMAGGARMGGL